MTYQRKPYNPNPPRYNPNDVTTWGYFKPTIVAHDVARARRYFERAGVKRSFAMV